MDENLLTENQERYNMASDLVDEVVEKYYQSGCACSHPRFIQLAGIDCVRYSQAFVCWETELIIGGVSEHFSKAQIEPENENYQEIWTCNHCSSTFLLSWSDFSAAIDRRVLSPREIKMPYTGKNVLSPIPLYAGLYGHGYPPKTEICRVDYDSLKTYLLEL